MSRRGPLRKRGWSKFPCILADAAVAYAPQGGVASPDPAYPGCWGGPVNTFTTRRSLLYLLTAAVAVVVSTAVWVGCSGDYFENLEDGGAIGPPGAPGPTEPEPPGPMAEELLQMLPVDFDDCAATTPAGDGDVGAAVCGPSLTQPGAQGAGFWMYRNADTLSAVFTADAGDLAPLPQGADCTTAQGVTAWQSSSGTGAIACHVKVGQARILWTHQAALVEGLVRSPGTSQADLARLYTWWIQHGHLQM